MNTREPRKLKIALGLALALGTIALYCPVLWHGFINYDDPDYILDNSHVKPGLTWSGIVWAFRSSYSANWHPLTWISHMADCQFFGLNPAGHHLVNVLFHTANTLLLFILLNQLTGAIWRSAFVAALFAWHPLHVESVAWAAERKDVLSAFFWMLTLIAYSGYARDSSGRWRKWAKYALALALFAGGLMSKPMVVTLPFVLLLLDFWPLQRFRGLRLSRNQFSQSLLTSAPAQLRTQARIDDEQENWLSTNLNRLFEKIPFFCLSAASCVVTLSAQHNALWSTASLPLQFRVANTLMSYVRYLSKIFIPTDLALIYPYPHSWPLAGVIVAGAVLVLLSLIFILQAKRFPYLAIGWFWFLGTLVPVIGLVQVGVQAIADRYTYLPAIGIFILVVWGINDLLDLSARKTAICAFAGACALVGCLVLTSRQLCYWQDSLTVFAHTVDVTTDNYAADDCLAKTLHNLRQSKLAERYYEQAVQLEPTYPLAQFDMGINLIALGDPARASNHLAIAVQLWPANPVMQYDFGVFLLKHGNPKEAAARFSAALADRPDFPQARQMLGTALNNAARSR